MPPLSPAFLVDQNHFQWENQCFSLLLSFFLQLLILEIEATAGNLFGKRQRGFGYRERKTDAFPLKRKNWRERTEEKRKREQIESYWFHFDACLSRFIFPSLKKGGHRFAFTRKTQHKRFPA